MVFPIRLNLVDIEIRQLDKVATALDPDFREPFDTNEQSSPVTIQGQVNFETGGRNRALDRGRTGDQEFSRGHVMFKVTDLEDLGVTIQKGDRITSIAKRTFDLEIGETRYGSPLNGVFLLLYAPFDRPHERRSSL